jgi:hypothetical protein
VGYRMRYLQGCSTWTILQVRGGGGRAFCSAGQVRDPPPFRRVRGWKAALGVDEVPAGTYHLDRWATGEWLPGAWAPGGGGGGGCRGFCGPPGGGGGGGVRRGGERSREPSGRGAHYAERRAQLQAGPECQTRQMRI